MTTVFIISAPSGSGKSTLTRAAARSASRALRFSISYTTRPPRGQERTARTISYLPRGVRAAATTWRISGICRGVSATTTAPIARAGARGCGGRGSGARHRCPGCATIKGRDSGRGVDFYSCAQPAGSGAAVAGALGRRRTGDRAAAARSRRRDSQLSPVRLCAGEPRGGGVGGHAGRIVKATRRRRDRMEATDPSDSGDV